METPTDYDWDAHYRSSDGSTSRAQVEAAELVLRHAPERVKRIADIGSGSGGVALLVARARPSASITGIDASVESCARATDNAAAQGVANADFSTGRAESLPFDNGAIDLVYADQLLQYTDEAATFTELARILRPGGRAVIIVPNIANVVFAVTALVVGDRHGSRRLYGRRRLSQLARAEGLRVVGWDGYLPAYPVQRLGYFYAPRLAPIGSVAERVSDRLDGATGRALSRRFGFGLAVIMERP